MFPRRCLRPEIRRPEHGIARARDFWVGSEADVSRFLDRWAVPSSQDDLSVEVPRSGPSRGNQSRVIGSSRADGVGDRSSRGYTCARPGEFGTTSASNRRASDPPSDPPRRSSGRGRVHRRSRRGGVCSRSCPCPRSWPRPFAELRGSRPPRSFRGSPAEPWHAPSQSPS